MRRRDLLTSYSLIVLADQLPAAQAPTTITPRMRRQFDRIAPPENQRARAAALNEPNMGLVDLKCDVFVAGGGVAGVCAAISAARHGAKVVLVQDRSRLGGNSSSEVKMHIVGADSHRGRPGWRESGLIEELRLEDAVNNPQRCWEMWDFLLYDKVVSEPLGGAHRDHVAMAQNLKKALQEALKQLSGLSTSELLAARYERLMSYGRYKEQPVK